MPTAPAQPPTPTDLRLLRSLAERAVRRGGEVVRSGVSERAAEEKSAGDYVTEVDRASERAIAEWLTSQAPDIPVIGEEEAGTRAHTAEDGDRYWLVDPLDGTTNFVHGFPVVGVSVALMDGGRPIVGAVHAPFLGETYVAARGEGAYSLPPEREPVPLAVSPRAPERAVVGTGFPFRKKGLLPYYLDVMSQALGVFEDLRRPGAASLDLAWVAGGVFEGFFELGLAPWDVAAGALLIEEAGGIVTDWDGGGGWLGGDILAGSPAVHAELISLTKRSGRR